jgi:hypothetical protein
MKEEEFPRALSEERTIIYQQETSEDRQFLIKMNQKTMNQDSRDFGLTLDKFREETILRAQTNQEDKTREIVRD